MLQQDHRSLFPSTKPKKFSTFGLGALRMISEAFGRARTYQIGMQQGEVSAATSVFRKALHSFDVPAAIRSPS